MSQNIRREPTADRRSLGWGLAAILALTLWRVALLPFVSADLFVDDAQYWFWGQDLAWGYYSKPPLIAWLLRASTEIGSDAPFWIRLPLPLLHGATAVVMMLVGRRLGGDRIGALAGTAYASLPGVAVGSLLVSTDTPMLACFALGMLAWMRLAVRRSAGWALVLGAAVGIGLLAKYAMIYFPLSAGLAALLLPGARIDWRDAGVAAAVALALVAPNLVWNASNDFATLQHTADNADWQGPRGDPLKLLEFWAGQFALSGPILFGAYLAGLAALRARPRLRFAAAMSVPVLAVVSVQALVSGANANWAASAHVGVVLIAAAVLAGHPRWCAAGLALNLAVAAALPVAAVVADRWSVGGELVLGRYVGQEALALRAAEVAEAEGLDTLVSSNRAYLAAFFYSLRDRGLAIYAEPVAGFPPHHFAQRHPLPPGPGEVLFVSRSAAGPRCVSDETAAVPVARWTPAAGFVTKELFVHRVPRACWHG